MAKYWEKDGDSIHCLLCPHSCHIKESNYGFCRTRSNNEGVLETPYGNLSSAHIDPIEKKPLYHFHPGTKVYSIGGWGCNLICKNCQNYQISQRQVVNSETTTAKDICKRALMQKCSGIAFTYNEPTIWYEFMIDVAAEAKKHGLYTVCVTNGYIEKEPFIELLDYIDAFNIDVKAFSDRVYHDVCGGSLDPVLDTIKIAVERKAHVELSYLMIPGINDFSTMLQDFAYWISEIDNSVPVHFTAFHPDYILKNISSTPLETLLRARYIGRLKGLKYVYLGNTAYPDAGYTICPQCGTIAVKRSYFHVDKTDGLCPSCGGSLDIIISNSDKICEEEIVQSSRPYRCRRTHRGHSSF